jgi:hypothetical protein
LGQKTHVSGLISSGAGSPFSRFDLGFLGIFARSFLHGVQLPFALP